MSCTDTSEFRSAVTSCKGNVFDECPAITAAAKKYGAQCLDLEMFANAPPYADYLCAPNKQVSADLHAVCNKLSDKVYHRTVVAAPPGGSSGGTSGDSSLGSDYKSSVLGLGRYGEWGKTNSGWQSGSSVGGALGTATQVAVPALVLAGVGLGIKRRRRLTDQNALGETIYKDVEKEKQEKQEKDERLQEGPAAGEEGNPPPAERIAQQAEQQVEGGAVVVEGAV